MNRTAATAELPDAYATRSSRSDDDLSNEELAALLGIELEAVDPFLRIAVAKLGAILAATDTSPLLGEKVGDS
jgi:hypothetical protein